MRKQKTDGGDARLILDLLLTNRFPKIWVPTPAERDLRQLLWHRHKLVGLRTMLGNQLHFLAMSQGLCRKSCSENMLGYLPTIRPMRTGRLASCGVRRLVYPACPDAGREPRSAAAVCRPACPPWRGVPGRAPRINLGTPISRLAPFLLLMFARWKGRASSPEC